MRMPSKHRIAAHMLAGRRVPASWEEHLYSMQDHPEPPEPDLVAEHERKVRERVRAEWDYRLDVVLDKFPPEDRYVVEDEWRRYRARLKWGV